MVCTKAVYGRAGKIQPQICAAILGENLVSGTASGQIYIWEDSHVAKVVPAHRSMVSSMQVINRQKMVNIGVPTLVSSIEFSSICKVVIGITGFSGLRS